MSKSDKLEKPIASPRAVLAKHPATYPEIILTSSEKGDGLDTLRAVIATME